MPEKNIPTKMITFFEGQLRDAGLLFEHLEADGRNHRCGTRDKPKKLNGFYKVHLDDPANITWINYDEGTRAFGVTFKAAKELTPKERKELQARIAKERAKYEKIQGLKWKAAAICGEKIFQSAGKVNPDFPYLVKKQIKPVGEVRQAKRKGKDCLVIPLRQKGAFTGLQYIYPDSTKIFIKGTKKKGSSFVLPGSVKGKDKPIYIGEGYATCASAYEALERKSTVIMAIDAGNLIYVAEEVRKKYPERVIVILADIDKPGQGVETNGGTGVKSALLAAKAVKGLVAIPRFEGMVSRVDKVDFNDLHIRNGLGDVCHQITMARSPEDVAKDLKVTCIFDEHGEEQEKPVTRVPNGFCINPMGKRPGLYVVKQTTDSNGEPSQEETFVCPPLEILGESRDDESSNWGKWLQWFDPDGREHKWAMPSSMLATDGAELAGSLLRMGLKLDPTRKRDLLRYLSQVETDKRVRCVLRVGWHDLAGGKQVYVLPDAVIGDAGEETVVLQTAHVIPLFAQRGELSGQVDLLKLCLGNSRLLLAVCASFAGPLLALTNIDSGGYNLWGGSSTGKSTTLLVAGSIWDHVETLPSWRSTVTTCFCLMRYPRHQTSRYQKRSTWPAMARARLGCVLMPPSSRHKAGGR